jgi:hypothetical protein
MGSRSRIAETESAVEKRVDPRIRFGFLQLRI